MSFPAYPEYKDSGVEWLGEVPAHWNVKRVRFVAQLNPRKSEVRSLSGDTEVSFIPMEAVGEDGSLRVTQTRPLDEVLDGYTYLRDGDIGVAKITPCFENGKVAVMEGLRNGLGFGTTELTVLRPHSTQVTSRYLYRVIQSEALRDLGESEMYGAGGQKRVPDDFVRDFAIAWPPVAEQRTIAAFLDHETARIDALIEEQRRLIELLKEKRQAVISHAVTKGLDPNVPMKDSGVAWLGEVPAHWDAAKLGFYADLLTGYPFPSSGFSNNESDVALLRGANVGVSYLKWDDTVYWPVDQSDEFSRYLMRDGQIVIGMDRPWIGEGLRIARVRSVDTPCLLLQRVAAISSLGKIDENYLFSLFDSGLFKAYVEPDLTGVSVPHISPEQILGFVVPLPPMSEQIEIAKYIDEEVGKTSKLLGQAEVTIDLLVERRSALISAAVTGKIDVRDWQPPEGCSRTETEFSEGASA